MRRRGFLRWSAAAAGAAALSGCDGVYGALSRQLGARLPDTLEAAAGTVPDRARRLLDRAAYGPWPGDCAAVREHGVEAWVDAQLDPESIDDLACTVRSRRIHALHLPAAELYEYKERVLRDDLARHTLLRAVYSRRQLKEVMVGFWLDHFNINIHKGECAYLAIAYVRDVVRAHALGRFRDLVRASATHPAMLHYLDGRLNQKRDDADVPNENYARELLELHTLGVDGGYSQQDVMEAARCLTGWRVRGQNQFRKAEVRFDPASHDQGEKRVLGERIAAEGGAEDLERLIDVAVGHPSTARYLSWKLCRRFVAQEPPPALVDSLAEVYRQHDGDLKAMLRHLLLSEELYAAPPKLKRPFRFVASALRGLAADTFVGRPILGYLERLGQMPAQYPTPDGYPDEAEPWMGGLLWRWRFVSDLASNRVGKTRVDLPALLALLKAGQGEAGGPVGLVAGHLLGRAPGAAEQAALARVADEPAALAGLVMASPAYQFS